MYLDKTRDFVLGYLRLIKGTGLSISYWNSTTKPSAILLERDSFSKIRTPEALYDFVNAMFPKNTVIYEQATGNRLATPGERQAAVNRIMKILIEDDEWFKE